MNAEKRKICLITFLIFIAGLFIGGFFMDYYTHSKINDQLRTFKFYISHDERSSLGTDLQCRESVNSVEFCSGTLNPQNNKIRCECGFRLSNYESTTIG